MLSWLTASNFPLHLTAAPLCSRTVRIICQRLLQPTGRFRRRSLSLVVNHLIGLISPSSKSGKFWVFALQVINSEA
jgi:hypothetical protein